MGADAQASMRQLADSSLARLRSLARPAGQGLLLAALLLVSLVAALTRLGLQDDFGYNVIKRIGNYSEVWERNLGAQSPYKLERGVNALWENGGVLWSIVID